MAVPELCLPSQGYLAYRLDHSRRTSKACDLFALMAGLVELAAALGKQVWIPGAGERLYLSAAVLLLGPSGAGWKSTTLAQSERIVRKLGKVNLLPRTGSKEAIEKALTEPPRDREEVSEPAPADEEARRLLRGAGLLLSDELGLLLDAAGKDYNRDLRSWLVSALARAGRIDHATVGERREASDLALSFLGCAPDEWFLRHMRPVDFLQGLVPRLELIPDDGRRPKYGLVRHYEEGEYNQLAKLLAHQTALRGALDTTLVEDAAAAFERHLVEDLGPRTTEEPVRVLDSRRLVSSLRYAALYHVAESESAIISPAAWERARALGLYLRQRVAGLIARHYAATPEGRLWKDVLAFIPYEGGRTRREIVRKFHLYEPAKQRVLFGLEQAGLIVRTGGAIKGDPIRYYRERPEEEGSDEDATPRCDA